MRTLKEKKTQWKKCSFLFCFYIKKVTINKRADSLRQKMEQVKEKTHHLIICQAFLLPRNAIGWQFSVNQRNCPRGPDKVINTNVINIKKKYTITYTYYLPQEPGNTSYSSKGKRLQSLHDKYLLRVVPIEQNEKQKSEKKKTAEMNFPDQIKIEMGTT